MKTIIVKVEDNIFDRALAFLRLFPKNSLEVITKIPSIPYVDKNEQREIEEILKDKECFEMELKETI